LLDYKSQVMYHGLIIPWQQLYEIL